MKENIEKKLGDDFSYSRVFLSARVNDPGDSTVPDWEFNPEIIFYF